MGQDGDRWMVGGCTQGSAIVAATLASTGAPCINISMDSLRGLREHTDATGCKFRVKKQAASSTRMDKIIRPEG